MTRTSTKAKHGRTRAQRLETRVTAEQKNLIERAAALQGRTITDFVLASVQDAARRTIEQHQQIELSVRDSEAFVEALLVGLVVFGSHHTDDSPARDLARDDRDRAFRVA